MEVKHTHEMNEARKDITFGGVFRLNTGDVFLKHAKERARCARDESGGNRTHAAHNPVDRRVSASLCH